MLCWPRVRAAALRAADVAGNHIGSTGAMAIAGALKGNATVERIDLSRM
jgi:hypothetical protein